jgi:hypothetical protein
MTPYYLKSTDEAALYEALEAAGLYKKVYSEFDEEGNPIGDYELQRVGQYDLDVIGEIWKDSGETTTDDEGNVVPVMEKIDGYHANIRGITEEQAALLPTIEAPASPVRIWAGD